MQPADYDRFKPFFSKVLADYHTVPEDAKHVNNWSLEGVKGLPEGGVLDLTKLGLPELSMRVRVGRNLKEFPLPGAMTKEDRIAMEAKMCKAFDVLKAKEEYGGGYNSLTPGHENFINDEQYNQLVKDHIMFKDMAADSYLAAAGIASDWPYGRGCYVSGDKQFVIWVGEEDHLRIMCMKKGAILNEVFDRLKAALDVVNGIEGLEFASSPDYGMVTSCPTNLGTGMRASVHIPIPHLTKDGTDKKAKEICKPLGLSVRGTGGEHTPIGADGTCDISPSARFIITEAEIITALYNGLKLLKEKEDEAGGTTDSADSSKPAAYFDVTGISLSGLDASSVEANSLSDPYVKVEVGPVMGRTPTVWNSTAPSWASRGSPSLELSAGTAFPLKVIVTCMDDDKKSDDDAMGTVSFEVTENGKGQKEIDFASGKGKLKIAYDLTNDKPADGYKNDSAEQALQASYKEKLAKIRAVKESNPGNRAIKHFDFDYFNSLESDEDKQGLLRCVNSGIENADSGMGCYAMQPADYDRFKPFFSKVLADYHTVPEDAKHVNNCNLCRSRRNLSALLTPCPTRSCWNFSQSSPRSCLVAIETSSSSSSTSTSSSRLLRPLLLRGSRGTVLPSSCWQYDRPC